jgi:hypothetical protein
MKFQLLAQISNARTCDTWLQLLIGLGIYICHYDALVSNVKNSGNDE